MDRINNVILDYYFNYLIKYYPRVFFKIMKVHLYPHFANVLYRNNVINSYKQYQILSKTGLNVNMKYNSNDDEQQIFDQILSNPNLNITKYIVYYAVDNNLPQVIQYILKYLPADDINNIIIHADNLTSDIIKILVNNGINNNDFLHRALLNGDLDLVIFLLQNDYSLNITFEYNNLADQTTLTTAVYYQRYQLVKYLLEKVGII